MTHSFIFTLVLVVDTNRYELMHSAICMWWAEHQVRCLLLFGAVFAPYI